MPPQAIEIEEAVLGCLLQFENAADLVFDVLGTSDVFYKTEHANIFKAVKDLYSNSEQIDLLTVSARLEKLGIKKDAGGDYLIIGLTQKVASSAHVEYHARLILEKYMLRRLIAFGSLCVEKGFDASIDINDTFDELGAAFDTLTGLSENGTEGTTWQEAIDAVPKRVEFLTNNQGELTGVDTGLFNLNRHFGGWQNSDLIIIGADSGMGKTALAMTHILASAKQGNAVGMVSMEMSTVQLAIRSVAVDSNYHMRQLTQDGFDKTEYFEGLSNVVAKLRNLPVYIDDRPSLTVPEMKRRARQMKRKHNIKLFIADFIQMFTGDEDDIKLTGMAARELKNLAKELNIPVIALSQLNREVRKARYCIPSKHHLKNSSGVEEAADIIGLLYRPSYYKFTPEKNPDLFDELRLQGDENAVFIVAKNRNGGLGEIPMCYVEDKTKYINPSKNYQNVMVASNGSDLEDDSPF